MSYLDWKVGDKVVCIKRGGWNLEYGTPNGAVHPKYGEICTLASVECSPFDGVTCVRLVGYDKHDLYRAKRFRPVQPRKSDISLFAAMLTTKKRTVDA